LKAEYINPFLSSAVLVFDTMLGCELKHQDPFLKKGSLAAREVSGIIGLSGGAKGTVVLSIDREVALSATEVMLQERPEEINSDVTDAVGELTNMIVGGAKAKLEHFALSVSLPNVVTGKGHCIEFPSEAPPICIPFDCEWGRVVVEVGFVEESQQAAEPVGAGSSQTG
jgi:chemotaxis protein CheX